MKPVADRAHERQGLGQTPVLDGFVRTTPDALAWIEKAKSEGVRAARTDRDGPRSDDSLAPAERRPDRGNVSVP